MNLQQWLIDTHDDLRRRLTGSVLDQVPAERWTEQADGGGSSITWIVFHLSRHQDLALTTVIRNHAPLYAAYADALGVAHPEAGLTEREHQATSEAIDPTALVAYSNATFDATRHWLDRLSVMALDTVPDTE
jgi:hypothetical protein